MKRSDQPNQHRVATRYVVALTASLALVPPLAIAARGAWRPRNTREQGRPRFPTMVVLGTAQYDGIPSRQFAARLQWAAELWQQVKMQDIITLGGQLPGDRYTEAEVGRDYLLTTHVDADLLHEVGEGNDTRGSFEALKRAAETGQVPVNEPLLIVTDPNHALRAELIARQVGFKATSSGTPHVPTQFPSRRWWRTLLHETGGLAVVGMRQFLGAGPARSTESFLRGIQGTAMPSRRKRHRLLKENKNNGE